MIRRCSVLLLLLLAGCASLPLKQQAVVSLQASETALEAAHDLERGFCFVTPATEAGGHCTNPLAATLHLTDATHQRLADLFSRAFALEIKAAIALKAWRAGEPAPTDVAGYQKDISDILAVVKTLAPGAAPIVAKAQAAVDEAAKVATLLGAR